MKEEEKLREDLKNAIEVKDGFYKITPYRNEKENKKFGIVMVDSVLLHPSIRDEILLKKELYHLKDTTILSRGQINFEVQCNSREELLKVYLYLIQKGYKYTKILYESSRYSKEKLYTLEDFRNRKSYGQSIHNILSVYVFLKDLDKFKKDISEMRESIGIRNIWRSGGGFNIID